MYYKFTQTRKQAFIEGMRDGIPIGLGYLAVSFSLGILAKQAGLTPFQGFLATLLTNASAGGYVGFTLIAAGASYIEIALMTLVANARYLLMSTAMSQRMSEDLPLHHRLFIAFDITDELFAIAINRPGFINPFYSYGAFLLALPGWSIGTALGVIAGELLPIRLVSAFSVALYGMFLAIIIPVSKTNKVVAGTIIVCFICSYIASTLPLFEAISSGTRILILTVVIAAVVSIIFPHREEE